MGRIWFGKQLVIGLAILYLLLFAGLVSFSTAKGAFPAFDVFISDIPWIAGYTLYLFAIIAYPSLLIWLGIASFRFKNEEYGKKYRWAFIIGLIPILFVMISFWLSLEGYA